MIQEFTNGAYKYTLASPALVLEQVKLNNKDISKYLTDNSTIAWYDVSKNSGRDVTNADGTMVLNIISTKYRLDLVTRPLMKDEMVDFFSEIVKAPTLSVDFLDPFTDTWKKIECYRGDRSAQRKRPYYVDEDGETKIVGMFNPVSQAIIEL